KSYRKKKKKCGIIGDEFAVTAILIHFSTLCRDKYGFRTLQRLLHVSDSIAVKATVVEQLCANDHVLNVCSCNPYGNLVVQKLIQKLPSEWLNMIMKALNGKICEYCVDPYGSHVVQAMMECYHNDMDRMPIYNELLSKIVVLSQHVRGNYVVQKMVTICQNPLVLRQICNVLCDHVGVLCLNKISSNVIQLALRSLPLDYRNIIIDSIYSSKASLVHSTCRPHNHHHGPFKRQDIPLAAQLITHKYGNYGLCTHFHM
ncbi:RNA-binding protein Puf3 (predicted), partial [Reticulomyxa filosa]